MNQEQQPCICTRCGTALQWGEPFCPVCGMPADPQQTPPAPETSARPAISIIFCPACGASNTSGAYCTRCGTPLMPATPPVAPKAKASPKPQKKNTIWVVSIALYVAVMLVIGGWYLFSHLLGEKEESTESSSSSSTTLAARVDEKKEEAMVPPQLNWQITLHQANTFASGNAYILATFTDRDGQPIQGDLRGATLSLTEEIGGNRQVVSPVEAQRGSVSSVGLCVDVSASAQGSQLPQAMAETITSLPTNAAYAVDLFGEGVSTHQSRAYGAIALASSDLTCWNGTQRHLLDGMVQSIANLSTAAGTKHLIVIADGGDSGSTYSASHVADLATAQGVSIHLLALDSASDSASVENLANQYGWDYTLCTATNLADTIVTLSYTYAQTAGELWCLSYESAFNLSSGEETTVTITATQDDLTVQSSTTSHFWDGTQVSFEALQVKTQEDTDFIFSDSSTRLLTDADLQSLPLWDLYIARNEIYARSGRKFTSGLLQNWFNSKDWYQKLSLLNPTVFDSQVTLSDLEQKNIELIVAYEASWFDRNTTIFPDGATVEITSAQQTCMSTANLQIALNQLNALSATAIRDKNIATITAALAVPTIQY